ncbi:aldehyde dehydrogenase family protein [Bradyrhizobium sp. CCGUVB23]|uniref:aldehyde dehydrogenase family protein n=1 Tax=Bradyrhizobium sp. CCGUVB23 TaxID=2949630 RepID=UPI0020B3E4BD|nr:aldehyde dehydrogenase family protein [Bradyrhizobium sp. CCGUVB23]MCP3459366.1 aldehyde dehydrogenase family protein [Bradyrhizobium sp. CCGUVB23]
MSKSMGVALDLDSDLAGLADARSKAREARLAFQAFSGADQEKVDNIVRAMADAGTAAAKELARMAVDETGFGVYEDKILKNLYNTKFVAASMLPMRTVGVLWVDEVNRMTAVGSPMGVIAAIIPVTNPTSTVLFKCLAAVKSGNAIICAPHPRAVKCCIRTAEIMAEAAVKAGAPTGLISCLSLPTIQSTGELMRHPDVSVVLATGGPGMVRAAYSSGKPTFAVGAGNVPVYIHRSVKDVKEAALMAITSKSFDNGTACVAEQSIVLDEPIAEAGIAAFAAQGTFFLSGPDQKRLADIIFTDKGELRPEAVGLSAQELARRINLSVPGDCKVLGAHLTEVGPQARLSREILGPVLSFYRTADLPAGFERCRQILAFGGEGHTLGLHCEDDRVIATLAALPAGRIVINTPTLFGGMGYSCATDPSFMLGTGTWSGSIVSDNVTPLHLINIKRIAHEVRPWRSLYQANMGL